MGVRGLLVATVEELLDVVGGLLNPLAVAAGGVAGRHVLQQYRPGGLGAEFQDTSKFFLGVIIYLFYNAEYIYYNRF